MPASTLNKINDIMAIFEKVAKHDKKLKDTKSKLADPKKAVGAGRWKTTQKSVEKLEIELANELGGRSTSRRRRETG